MPSSSSVLTPSAAASAGMWSSASRRLPDSSRLSVETSMLAASATCCRVRPRSARSSRSRRRTRVSIESSARLPAWQQSLANRPWLRHPLVMDTNWECIVVGAGAAGPERRARARPRPPADARHRRRRAEQPRRSRDRRPARPGRPPARCVLRRGARGARRLSRASSSAPARSSAPSATTAASCSSSPSGERETARRVLLATGMDYRRPELAGRRGALGPLRVPLPLLPWLGGPRPRARSARPRRRPACGGRCCCERGATT